jgi:hypothetical protein
MQDVLSGGIPKRLLLHKGVWSLEVVRQVAVERSVYRPVKQLIEGPDVIMRYFKRAPELKTLGMAAMQLLQAPPSDQDRSFDAINGEWVPTVIAPSYITELKRQQLRNAQHSTQVQLLDVRTECLRLRHANSAMITRVCELEKKVAWLVGELETLRNQRPVYVQNVPAIAETVVADVKAPVEVEKQTQGQHQPLDLPPPDDMIRCLEQLIGSDVTANEIPVPPRLPEVRDTYFVASMMDDNDVEVGAVFMDLKATVYLGGNLLMVPENELSSQVRSKRPSEDSIAASSEVCNALSGCINNVTGNPHIRTTFLLAQTEETAPWLKSARSIVVLQDSLGGKLLVAAR